MGIMIVCNHRPGKLLVTCSLTPRRVNLQSNDYVAIKLLYSRSWFHLKHPFISGQLHKLLEEGLTRTTQEFYTRHILVLY